MKKIIGVDVDGQIEWHVANHLPGVDTDTLCHIDANDSAVGHFGTVEPRHGQKVTCEQCYYIWKGVMEMRLRRSMFAIKN